MLKLCILLGMIAACCSEPRIEGGVPVEIENFPYAVSVQAPGPRGRIHVCTGTILNNRWVLTTASLPTYTSPRAFQIRTGSTNSAHGVGPDYSVEEKILHPSFDPKTKIFNLALLKVDKDIVFTSTTKSIKLSSKDSIDANLSGNLVGWGNTFVNSVVISRLYLVELKTVGTIDGTNLYVSAIHDDILHICISDVGGAFVVDGKVIGISTLNQLGCGLNEKFVTRFDENTLKWINSVTA